MVETIQAILSIPDHKLHNTLKDQMEGVVLTYMQDEGL